MKINICSRHNQLDRDGQKMTLKLFSSALDHLKQVIQSVRITVEDENGPRGGIDKTCSAQIKMVGGGFLVLREKASNFHQAIALTAERAKESLTRWHGKRKSLPRRQGRKLSNRSRRLIALMEV